MGQAPVLLEAVIHEKIYDFVWVLGNTNHNHHTKIRLQVLVLGENNKKFTHYFVLLNSNQSVKGLSDLPSQNDAQKL